MINKINQIRQSKSSKLGIRKSEKRDMVTKNLNQLDVLHLHVIGALKIIRRGYGSTTSFVEIFIELEFYPIY